MFGGTITWRLWNWGESVYSLTGNGNIGWISTGDVVQNGHAAHPDVAYSWYVDFLQWIDKTAHPALGFLVAFRGQTVV